MAVLCGRLSLRCNGSPRARRPGADFQHAPTPDRLLPAELTRLRAALLASGINLRDSAATDQKLSGLRQMYEPYVNSLADYLLVTIPDWIPPTKTFDNWQTSAWGRISGEIVESPLLESREDGHL